MKYRQKTEKWFFVNFVLLIQSNFPIHVQQSNFQHKKNSVLNELIIIIIKTNNNNVNNKSL